MLERFVRRESLLFPLPAQRVKRAFDEIRELVGQSPGFTTVDQNRRMEEQSPDFFEFIAGRKSGYREELSNEEYQAYVTGVAVTLKAIEDSVSTIGISMPKITWKQIRKYEIRRVKAWNKLDKESHGKTDFVELVFKSMLDEDISLAAFSDMFGDPIIVDDFSPTYLRDVEISLQRNKQKFYACVGISDIYFPLRRADERANRRK